MGALVMSPGMLRRNISRRYIIIIIIIIIIGANGAADPPREKWMKN